MKQLIALMVLTILIAGCIAAPSNSGNSGNAQMANPAAVFCIENGGTLEIITEAGGQRGLCILADGSTCDEWAYFRGECPATVCAADAKVCPDGSAIRRVPPDCEFAACPGAGQSFTCTEEQKEAQICTLDYTPVCGDNEETYGNKCEACADAMVAYWTEGECPA